MRYVYNALREGGYKVLVCAPTGKAARRITEATGAPAKTIHMALQYPRPGDIDPKTGKALDTTTPARGQRNPLDEDIILADEYAMVSQELHRNLVNAMKPGSRICIFGDVHQLPPIETDSKYKSEPSPFSTMLKKFNGYYLKTIHRQGEGSVIVSNGDRILNGFSPIQHDDFKLMFSSDNQIGQLIDRVMELTQAGIDFASLDAQILTPIKISVIGSHALNQRLQQILEGEWADRTPIALPRHEWDAKWPTTVREGSKIIITKNLYAVAYENSDDMGVFNGETGIVLGLSDDGDALRIDLGGRIAVIPYEITQVNYNGKTYTMQPWKDIQLAYAVTTHKAQGSEFQHIIYVMSRSAYRMLNRMNFYTAISRARKSVTVITDQDGLSVSLRTKQAAL